MAKRVTKFLVEVAYIEGSADLTVTVADDLNNWLDAADYLLGVPIGVADSLDNWVDGFALVYGYEELFADSLNNWLDAPRAAIVSAILNLSIADDLNYLVDGVEGVYIDDAAPSVFLGDRLILDDGAEIFVGSPVELTDDLNNWGDEVELALVIPVIVEDTNEYSWADLVVASVPIGPYSVIKADSVANLADAVSLLVGHFVPVGDTLVMADSAESLFSYIHAFGDSLNAWADATALLINTAPGAAADTLSMSDDSSIALVGVLSVNVSDNLGNLSDTVLTSASCAYNDAVFRSYVRRWLNDV